MATIDEIIALVSRATGMRESEIAPYAELERDLGIQGDDFSELVEAFADRFRVDMSTYRWYFHHAEEPTFQAGALLFRPPHRRVSRIPVTPELLRQAATAGHWPVRYPAHQLPAHRYDIVLTYVLFFLLFAGLIAIAR